MKEIPLTKGKFAIVDNEDFEFVNHWRWKYHKDGYAVRTATGGKQIYMHREINKTPKGCITDHINRNGLDNRRANLRVSTYSQNGFNAGMWGHNTSGVKGVGWNEQKGKWQAKAMVNQKNVHIGFFSKIGDAAKARTNWEKLHYAI